MQVAVILRLVILSEAKKLILFRDPS